MPSAVSCKLLFYADDSALVVAGKDIVDMEHKLSYELEPIRENLGRLNQSCSDKKSCVKYVGGELDQSMSGDLTGNKIVSISNAKLNFLYQQARNVNIETKKLLVSALIQCQFD